MSAGRRLVTWAALAGSIATGVAVWYLSPALVRGLVFFRPHVEREASARPEEAEAVRARVEAALAALGANAGPGMIATAEERSDRAGTWTVRMLRWEIPEDSDAGELGGRLRALLAAKEPGAEVYVVRDEGEGVRVRAYAGSRLATVVDLSPVLSAWPPLAPTQRPLLSLVLTGIDADPHAARARMAAGLPLAVALSPYSPFTLRLSRDALSTHTEVLAWAEPDATLSESVEAVPWATGVLVASAPRGEPDAEAALLAKADVYVLDATEMGLDTRWLAAFDAADVQVGRPLQLDPADPETAQRRLRHAAARRGGAILTLPVAASPLALDALLDAGARGYRVAFPAEVMASQTSGAWTAASPP